ncbi:MAG: hypothetical protein U0T77_03815 [Chitinophagales bacterium]
MKRKKLVTIHLIATIVAVLAISTFFTISLIAEIKGNDDFIRSVKAFILYALPIMVLAMPTLKITGDKLAGKSKSPLVLAKIKRMKLVLVNGMILISLAIFLYYRSHYQQIDNVFLIAQIAEFAFGLFNLSLIFMNAKAGMQLSGKLKISKK